MSHGLFILYGSPGSGKSSEAASCFQDSLYLMSSPNLLHFYEQYLVKKNPALKMPKRSICVDTYSVDSKVELYPDGPNAGMPKPVAQKDALELYFSSAVKQILMAKAKNEATPWKNIVIDEVGTFWQRVFEEIAPTCLAKNGSIDTRGAYGEMNKWNNRMINLLRQALVSANVVMIAHDQDPDPSEGRKGGPKLVSQGIQKQLCADADAIVLRAMEDREVGKPAARTWVAHGTQNQMSKIRGLPDEMYAQIKDLSLAEIVKAAGFEA